MKAEVELSDIQADDLELLEIIDSTDGAEWRSDEMDELQGLRAARLIEISGKRGPSPGFHRVTLSQDGVFEMVVRRRLKGGNA